MQHKGENPLNKGVKLHFSAKKQIKLSSGNFSSPLQQNFQGCAEVFIMKFTLIDVISDVIYCAISEV